MEDFSDLTKDQIIDYLVRTADDYADDCVRAGYVTTRSKNRELLAERIKAALENSNSQKELPSA